VLRNVAVVYQDGRKEVVTIGRPADLIAFADAFDKVGPTEPYAIREIAWLTHRALKIELELEDWIESLEDITGDPDEVETMRAELAAVDPPDAGAPATPATLESARAPLVTSSARESHE